MASFELKEIALTLSLYPFPYYSEITNYNRRNVIKIKKKKKKTDVGSKVWVDVEIRILSADQRIGKAMESCFFCKKQAAFNL